MVECRKKIRFLSLSPTQFVFLRSPRIVPKIDKLFLPSRKMNYFLDHDKISKIIKLIKISNKILQEYYFYKLDLRNFTKVFNSDSEIFDFISSKINFHWLL